MKHPAIILKLKLPVNTPTSSTLHMGDSANAVTVCMLARVR